MQFSAVIGFVLPPVHLFLYSALLGMQLYQSFVMTKVAYQALPRSAFTTLQRRIFPVYFQSQSLLLLIVAATFPPRGPLSVIKKRSDWIAFGVAGITAALNLFVYGPRTKDLMIKRVQQVTRDAKTGLDTNTTGDEMKHLNRVFSRAHAMSIHLNLVTIGATIWLGVRLASSMRFEIE